MNVNKYEYFSGINFWKSGCNWGTGAPSYFKYLKEENIVIVHNENEIFKINDIVLIAEGYIIVALAKVISLPKSILLKTDLIVQLENYNFSDFENIIYYDVDFYELPIVDQFNYELRKGVVKVKKQEIKRLATQAWLNYSKSILVDKRIMRLTWNSNNWELPSGHEWNPNKRDKSNVAYENQYGYGHEEWLFNERFRIDGFQYGYVRGVEHLPAKKEVIDQITLYTIRDIDKQRCLVANLYNVEIIQGYKEEQDKIKDLIAKYKSAMIEELHTVNADYEHFSTDQLLPNVKFKWDEIELFQQPIPVDYLNGPEFNRFQAYYLKEELLNPIKQEFEKITQFNFQTGKASNTNVYSKTTTQKQTNVIRRHGEITDDLFKYLISKGNKEENISVERTRVGGAIVDLVLKHNDGFELFEVKTCNTAQKNIREALGQILEYALLDCNIKCKKLVIIGPAIMNATEKQYFNRLKNTITIEIEYWGYITDNVSIENKFIK